MDEKRTMTFNLTAGEMKELERLAAKKDMSKTALLRHALRVLVMMEGRLSRGQRLFVEDAKSKEKAELMLL
jgi:hypothetical protein